MEFTERDFFKQPFTRVEIESLLAGKKASEMFTYKSPSFKALGVDAARLNDAELVDLMLKEPRLIKRPVVRIGDRVLFGADIRRLQEALK